MTIESVVTPIPRSLAIAYEGSRIIGKQIEFHLC